MIALLADAPPAAGRRSTSRRLHAYWISLLLTLLLFTLAGCATLQREAVRINVVGLEPIAGQGMEMRFLVKLRVQNPNESPIDFNGVVLNLDLADKPFATGVSDQHGSIPRFGETVLQVPVSVSAMAVLRQALGIMEGESRANLPYTLSGRLAGGAFGGIRFHSKGTLDLPAPLTDGRRS